MGQTSGPDRNYIYKDKSERYRYMNTFYIFAVVILWVLFGVYLLAKLASKSIAVGTAVGNVVLIILFAVVELAFYLRNKSDVRLKRVVAIGVGVEFALIGMQTDAEFIYFALIAILTLQIPYYDMKRYKQTCIAFSALFTLVEVIRVIKGIGLQDVDSIVPGQAYRLTVKAKKTSTYNAYVRAVINGDTEIDLFNTSVSFEWTEYTALLPDVQDSVITIKIYSRDASLFVSDIMLTEGASLHKWTPAPNEIYTSEVKIDRRGIEVSNADSAQRTVINNTEFSGYYNEEKIFSLNKDETITKKTTVDGELTVGKTKFVPMATASEGLNIVILD